MAFRHCLPLAALLISASAQLEPRLFGVGEANNAPAFDGLNRGWCYFCSDDGAPPLCNQNCVNAIDRLCKQPDLKIPLTDTDGGCTIQYFPPVYGAGSNDQPVAVTRNTCTSSFVGILKMCGKDAGDARTSFDPAYCTTSGGGGTYGWNDDGSIMTGSGRYVVKTKGTDQCGQHQASWKQATSVIQWNDSWVGPDDQVVLDTNPPAASISDFPEPPAPNPECETEVCDIYDHPYYAKKGKDNWHEKEGWTRYQVLYKGFAEDAGATALVQAIKDRCKVEPYNFQKYFEDNVHKADFELPSNNRAGKCDCIPEAIYDASVGITLPRLTWCQGQNTDAGAAEFVEVHGGDDGLKKREQSVGLFKEVQKEPARKKMNIARRMPHQRNQNRALILPASEIQMPSSMRGTVSMDGSEVTNAATCHAHRSQRTHGFPMPESVVLIPTSSSLRMRTTTLVPPLLFFYLLHFTTARPATTTTANLTLDATLPQTIPVECVSAASWKAPSFIKEDCYVAVQDLYKWDYRWQPDNLMTFFSGFVTHRTDLTVHTPKRYVECVGIVKATCTLALVTLNSFGAFELPGRLRHGIQPVDKATYREVYQAARALEEQCVAPGGRPANVGWTVVGSRRSLGVFLWATESKAQSIQLIANTVGKTGIAALLINLHGVKGCQTQKLLQLNPQSDRVKFEGRLWRYASCKGKERCQRNDSQCQTTHLQEHGLVNIGQLENPPPPPPDSAGTLWIRAVEGNGADTVQPSKVASFLNDVHALSAPYLRIAYSLLPEPAQTFLDAFSSHLHRSLPHQLSALLSTNITTITTTQVLLTIVLPLFLLLFSMSTWGRFWPAGGRYSPFAANASQPPPTVTEADYHYLGPDDIDPPTQHRNESYGFPPPRLNRAESHTPDILVLKHRSTIYPLHFPAYAIADGDVTVGDVRRLAARETKTDDSHRIKLLYKGKLLRDDARSCRDEGLKQNSEILCVISEAATHPQSSSSASEDEMIENGFTGPRVDVDGTLRDDRPHRSRRKGHRGGGRKKKPSSNTATPKDSSTYLSTPEAPYSTSHHRDRSPSRHRDASLAATSRPAPTPAAPPQPSQANHKPAAKMTSRETLEALASRFHTEFVPQCIAFTAHPPSDAKTRDFEYKKLSETILAQIILKLDAVETDGDEGLRAKRKELVRETQAMLGTLDKIGKPGGGGYAD
ncbi:MAG: hypothetical protein Q9184_001588 [Pyrenodesmia sp. 2 TL-2023]